MIITIGSRDLFTKVIENKVLVLFSADYCIDCRQFKPLFEKGIKNCTIPVYQLDTTHLPEIARQQNIRSIPTLSIYAKGVVLDRLTDYTEVGLSNFLDKHKN